MFAVYAGIIIVFIKVIPITIDCLPASEQFSVNRVIVLAVGNLEPRPLKLTSAVAA